MKTKQNSNTPAKRRGCCILIKILKKADDLITEKVMYKSDNGLSIVFEDMPPYLLTYIDTMGVGSIEDQNMSIGGIYNSYAIGYDRRTVPIEIAVIGGEKNGSFDYKNFQKLKMKLAKVIDLNYQGELIYQNDYGAYSLRGRFTEIPTGDDCIGSNQNFSLNFVTIEQPKWKEKKERICRMGAVVGGKSFPFYIDCPDEPVSFGTYITTFEVNNDTYDALPVRILLNGPAEKITVVNMTTNCFMRFNKEITEDQQLEIDTEKGTAYILDAFTGERRNNANHYLTLDSDYWYLQRGRNVIHLDGGGQTNHPLGYLFWKKQFAGV